MTAATTPEMTDFVNALRALEPASENGGTYAAKSGYHNTRAGNRVNYPGNYSIVDAVDRLGPEDMCAAVDWTFPSAQHADYRTIIKYADRLMASSKDQQDPRLNVMREWYGQADEDNAVEGWDTRYGVPASSDPSHLWHIHFSFNRVDVASKVAYAAVLSVLRGETTAQWRAGLAGTQEDDVLEGLDRAQVNNAEAYPRAIIEWTDQTQGISNTATYTPVPNKFKAAFTALAADVTAIKAKPAVAVDATAVAAAILADPTFADRLATAVADKLAARLQS